MQPIKKNKNTQSQRKNTSKKSASGMDAQMLQLHQAIFQDFFDSASLQGRISQSAEAPKAIAVELDRFGPFVSDISITAARSSVDALVNLWEHLQPLVDSMVRQTKKHHPHVCREDLRQEAWLVLDRAVSRYDGRSADTFWQYFRLSLHTCFRQVAAKDRTIAVPHDTRKIRQSWHKVTRATFDARLIAQDVHYPDADTGGQGWDNLQTDGDNEMEDAVIEKMDQEKALEKLRALPRRWRDMLLMRYRYSDADLASLYGVTIPELHEMQDLAMQMIRYLPASVFIRGKTEAAYRQDLMDVLDETGGLPE
ncbi:hypothetical protein HF669_00030 [Acidithiobacillus thiooxidans]|uniref:hypothetical protein n=1 Tax=Acidithiobacillus TaxID=119977 RepID=UPI0002624B0D|nr:MULTISPECIES: hypothetical protein [Acidithiobacillus]MBU2740267.1 hypothetical protein [Acidithiobacillus albertensis]MBU2809800.1 hypothetical protein [Acidithiobacillus thiooxidans]MBU2834269.1 hypothetical protein [Acidithiobacillus thiooxidans]